MSRTRSAVLALLCGLFLSIGVGGSRRRVGRIAGTELIPITVQDVSDQPPAKAELYVDGGLAGVDDTEWSVSKGGCGIVYGRQYWSSNTITLVVEN